MTTPDEVAALIKRLEEAGGTGLDLSPGDPLCAAAARALKSLSPPAGMVMVPREPTKAMLNAGYEAAAFPRDPEICVAMWKAMLSAQERTDHDCIPKKGIHK